MHVLVAGGTEFVSLHLVRAVLRDGHQVTVLNRGRRPDRVPAGVRTLVADRKDHAALRKTLAGERFDAVVDVTYAPTLAEDVAALLDAPAAVGRVLFVSSGRVYDHARPIPFDEDTPRTLYWGEYARHKIAVEDLLLARQRERGTPVTIVRPTHIYGPLNTRNNETFFFDRFARGRPVLVPDRGGWLRQFGHVEDLADAMAAMLETPAAAGRAYNVTGEETITQVGFVELIGDVMGCAPRLLPVPTPAGGKPVAFGQNLVYDCHAVYTTTRLRAELGLRPRYTLAAGLTQTLQWYRREGLDRRPVDFTEEDALLRTLGA